LAGPLPTGVISGVVTGDVIQVDRTVTGVSLNQTSTTQGTLTLTNGAAIAGTLALAGNFATSLFHVDITPATGFATISVQTPPVAATTGTAGTGTDAYSWTGTSGGVWT